MPPAKAGPRWRRIRDQVAEEITAGGYGPGERLPAETDLSRRFGVHRHTVRRAMDELAADNLVRIEQGRGTFVQEPVLDYSITGRTRFSDIATGSHREAHSRLLRSSQEVATTSMAEALWVPVGTPVLLLEIARFIDELPLALTSHFFPLPRFDGLIDTFHTSTSLTSALYAFGVRDYFRQHTRVVARLPDAHEADLLHQPQAQPVLEHRSINVDADNQPIEFAVGRYAGQRVRFVFEPHPPALG